ncbi:proline racemase [Agrobacterium vitis]|uniref:proline racemase family protein n=1 Tax=Rhizobium/Agrobacterium group TaxID=227290 RepID=UPI0012E7B970|nr:MULTISPECIES: proline racemase family protein [Rhizobium/Agrobacterium group]MCF1464721.1 proline racemase [Allorhizobium ampelinum]MVA52769.1 proline racemase [Agrobacterium vitis]
MRWKKTVSMIEVHAEGEVGRVVTSGVLDIPGATMLDKMTHINEVDDSVRRFLCFEPRGYAQMSTNLLFAPTRPDADAAFIVMQADRAHAMSGSNSICVVTALLETGIVAMTEPETIVHLDTPAGLVKAVAQCADGKCVSVSLDMSPSFADQLDAVVQVEGLGPIKVDIAFGGIFYALIDPSQFGMSITPASARDLADIAMRIHRAVDAQLDIVHPTLPAIKGISYTMFTGRDDNGDLRGATVLPPGRFDRSPCGTGNSARLACMAARGLAKVGDRFTARSIIDSKFEVEITGVTEIAGRAAILPRITGRGWIHGFHQVGLDPSDPFPEGYLVADCWGNGMDLLK